MRALLFKAVAGALIGGAIVAATVAHSERAKRQSGREQVKPSASAKVRSRQDIPIPGRRLDALKPKSKDAERESKAPAHDAAGVAAVPAPPAPDEWSQEEVVSALRECIALLGPIAAEVEVTVPIKKGACGTAAPVRLRRIGRENAVVLSPPATMNCPMVVALHKWIEAQVQPEAERSLGSRVVSLENVSAYNCRQRNGSKIAKLSEHALANAIDIGQFRMADGQTVSVLKDWGPTARDLELASAKRREQADSTTPTAAPPSPATQKAGPKDASAKPDDIPPPERRPDPTKRETSKKGHVPGTSKKAKEAGRVASVVLKTAPPDTPSMGRPPPDAAELKKTLFLKRVHERACGLFGTVLGPDANEAHRDHFHFDLAPRRRSAYCE